MKESPRTKNAIIDIQDQDNLLAGLIMGEETSFIPSSCCCIYKVPGGLRRLGKEIYEPHTISIGPYHHGKETLRASEEYKVLYLQSFIRHSPNTNLRDFVKAIREIEVEARKCYAEEINLKSDEFVKMMVLDGCFILELFLKYQVEESNMESKDCLFNATWKVPCLRRDMILLENQIPFIVLDRLYNISRCPTQTLSLIQLALDFFDPILPTVLIHQKRSLHARHVLDLLRNFLVDQFKPMDFGDNPFWEYTTCATSLEEVGVKFQRKNTGKCLLDITFTRDGKLEISPFTLGEAWSVVFPNLIALEQCRRDYPDLITSYVIFVNKLINSHKDVKLLSKKGIIECLFIKEDKVAQTVDKICQEVVVDKFYYDGLCNRVNAYRRAPQNKWRATLMHNHFKTSFVVISYGVAVILLVLILAQTSLVTSRSLGRRN